ncbi:MAG: hypothetical protein EP338_11005 [Bacteroidetes bacterium]|nr:MAG: hypothetical protein EP338_11005 [Bacteroidota bacterium]
MDKTLYCFSANRVCHHDDYYRLVNKIRKAENIKSFGQKLKILFSKKSIVFMDIDSRDLMLAPFMILRSLWGAKAIALSVRTEYLCNHRTFVTFFTKRGKVVYVKGLFKRILFWSVKNLSSTRVYSIHKNTEEQAFMSKFVYGFIYDIQLWDLALLNFEEEIPEELKEAPFGIENAVLFAGEFDEKRSRTEFLNYIRKHHEYNFLMSGLMQQGDYDELMQMENVHSIRRYVTNNELFYLMKNSKIIYCFYTNERPSGFFGRALQLNKHIIVRDNTYLSRYFKHYSKLIPVEKLEDLTLEGLDFNDGTNAAEPYDDSEEFKAILMKL